MRSRASDGARFSSLCSLKRLRPSFHGPGWQPLLQVVVLDQGGQQRPGPIVQKQRVQIVALGVQEGQATQHLPAEAYGGLLAFSIIESRAHISIRFTLLGLYRIILSENTWGIC